HFLIEDYNVALTPGLKLMSPQPIPRENIQILAAGLTEGRQGFAPLSHVASEMSAIQSNIPQGEVLLDQAFTRDSLKRQLQSTSFPIVHIATHGQFSSVAEDTFILSWDKRINVTELDQALQNNSLNGDTAIELLVLSACETAKGDKQAALGLAGTAVRAGARSTLATLWSVNDEATAKLIGHFYEALTNSDVTRAEALRQAQLKLLQNPQYRHPIYWAPYILLGNWL
ncbi:MAG: CHAT domain-containing protein, partial [Leptolyngbya sp. SIO3F4]|nr:CHAT domain-containing protein [Leptolyngbya sp. SIO3F4]